MIKKSNKEVDLVNAGKTVIYRIMHGKDKVWEVIFGCFTRGYWLNDKKWTNNRGWKND